MITQGLQPHVNTASAPSLLTDRVCNRRLVVCQAREPRAQRTRARRAHFAADGVIVTQLEGKQERLERQALDRKRAQDHRERRQQDQVAIHTAYAGIRVRADTRSGAVRATVTA